RTPVRATPTGEADPLEGWRRARRATRHGMPRLQADSAGPSANRQRVRRAGDTVAQTKRCRREHEVVPTIRGARLGQRIEVEQLADRHSQPWQQLEVEEPALGIVDGFATGARREG